MYIQPNYSDTDHKNTVRKIHAQLYHGSPGISVSRQRSSPDLISGDPAAVPRACVQPNQVTHRFAYDGLALCAEAPIHGGRNHTRSAHALDCGPHGAPHVTPIQAGQSFRRHVHVVPTEASTQ